MNKEIKLGDTAILRCVDFERKVVVVCRDDDAFVVRAENGAVNEYWPVDGKYLHKVGTISLDSTEWYDYETQKAMRLPPVGEKVDVFFGLVFSPFKCTFVGIDSEGRIVVEKIDGDLYRYMTNQINLRPLDWNRKAEAERKRIVDAAQKVCVNFSSNDLGKLYDAGYLRMPADKD